MNEILTKIVTHQLTITDLRKFEPNYKKLHSRFSQPDVRNTLSKFGIELHTGFLSFIGIGEEPEIYRIRREDNNEFQYSLETSV
jgi:hypothetical protein